MRLSISDRQLQHGGRQTNPHMSRERTDEEPTARDAGGRADGGDDGQVLADGDGRDSAADAAGRDSPRGAPDIAALDERLQELNADFEAFEADVRERTVDKPAVESELKGYVRAKLRRGHARGWGPYLVLLYGTVMTLAAFVFFESDGLAILAMLIIFLSTLGLYTLFVLVGVGFNLLGIPGKAADFARNRRE